MNRHLHLKPMDGAVGAVKYPLIKMVEKEFEKHEPPLVALKPYKVVWEEDAVWVKKNTYMENFEWYMWSHFRLGRANEKAKLYTKCEHYMRDHGENLINLFLLYTYKTIEQAIINTETLTDLWNEFYEWFSERKRNYMESMRNEIIKQIEQTTGVSVATKPQSCGGVANLLKVLTKTMEKQGADITSIAKMQMCVCVQNGVYLPDEFITDVATVLDGEVV